VKEPGSRPTVTVIVPSYDRAACLPATIDSILGQTVPPDEIIVVDDGSRDDTRAVCERFLPRVRYIHRLNGGTAAAKNTGMREARGEFITFLDADDIWEPTKLEVQLALHQAHPEVRWSVTNHTTTDAASRPLPGAQGFARDFPAFTDAGLSPDAFFASALRASKLTAAGTAHVIYTGDAYELLFWGNFAFPSCVMLHRSLMDRVGFFDETFRYASDTEYFHRFGAAAPVGVIMTPLFLWRRGAANSNVSSGNLVEIVQNALKSIDRAKRLRGEPSERLRALHVNALRRLLLRLACIQLSNLDTRSARATLHEAWSVGARTARTMGLWAATLLPPPLLGLYRLKRIFRR
jgi:glycosyltransferase involved in cell wall biosynthesis